MAIIVMRAIAGFAATAGVSVPLPPVSAVAGAASVAGSYRMCRRRSALCRRRRYRRR